ncbi:hypothetical protein EX30DRAFT_344969 [Ascodesmis nigricans]|uniref:Uncharacterized protein n=1 Tax=Ascodesmis nigricans TaxID=341454 RepID=A0A4S2MHI7_9PEZI|nr:hypothetical protein EX30DRAFT_344969 [Ascodesmis nigricans]
MSPSSHLPPNPQPTASLHSIEPDPDPFPEPQSLIPLLRLPPPVLVPRPLSSSVSAFGALRDPLTQLHNQAGRLSSELQQLIDAQAEALLGINNASTSPHRQSPAKRPSKARLSLSDARNGLLTAMRELVDVRAREAMIYGDMATEQRELAQVVRVNEKKTTQIRDELSKIHASPEAERVEKLREEQSVVTLEVSELRQKLRRLEAKNWELEAEITEAENVVKSRSASYEGSLNALSKKTTAFLSKHRQLNPQTALESWAAEAEACTVKMEAASREKEALESGIMLWQECLSTVRGYESMMREAVRNKTVSDTETRSGLVKSLDKATHELEDMLSAAEASKWNLLEVCIGSELQALREASAILNGVVSEP